MARGDRQAKARGANKPPAKTAKAERPASSSQATPVFCFRYADRATVNAWTFQPVPSDASELFTFMCSIATSTWAEIESQRTGGAFSRHKKHHSQSLASIDPKAQQDIKKQRLDEIFGDEIFRFRLSGEKRLWGFRANRVFHVAWWDPNHLVCPTDPS